MSESHPHYPGLRPDSASRRLFLRRSAALSIAASAAPWAMTLAAMGEAAAQSATDYKALVCVFLYGGNDHANTLVPYDAGTYNSYQALRRSLATPRDALGATLLNPSAALADGRQFALAPQLAPLMPVFNGGRLNVVLNVGTLVQPTTKQQYTARSVPLPPKLFSHNDQQSYWESAAAEGASSGWGGRMGDLLASGNGNATFTCVSVAGNAIFLSGNRVSQYQTAPSGPVAVTGLAGPLFGSAACSTALRGLMTDARSQYFENSYVAITRRAIAANEQLSAALGDVATPFPAGNPLADQLRMVARMIDARNRIGARRQVFLVSLGGFDTHGSLNTTHPPLLANLGGALAAFDQAMTALGVSGQVTTFTASDFGRTLTSNASGSDHGWGSMQFVMGGAVQGRGYTGTAPAFANDGPDDVGQGRLLPTLSVEQFGATLAQWFGVSASDQLTVLPNLRNFSARNLGFMS